MSLCLSVCITSNIMYVCMCVCFLVSKDKKQKKTILYIVFHFFFVFSSHFQVRNHWVILEYLLSQHHILNTIPCWLNSCFHIVGVFYQKNEY
uniref:Uncharacterized protein n=1 Tax=Octopus bimaculoides TaxID=37653 RepID=A0A0L8FJP8_OCTBM